MNFTEIRKKYPDYNDMSDEEFAKAFHKKYYSDLDFNTFSNKIGYKAQGLPKTEKKAQRTTIGEDLRQGFAGVGNLADTFGTMALGGAGTLLGMNKDGKLDSLFAGLAERKKSRQQWAGGEGKEKGVSGNIISALSGLPGLPLAPVSGLERSTDLMDKGVPLSEAGPAGIIDSALSTGAAMLPVFGKTLLSKGVTGALGNVITGGASDAATQGIVSDKNVAKDYDPLDWKRRAAEAVMGAAGGMVTGKTKPKSNPKFDPGVPKAAADKPVEGYKKSMAEKVADNQTVANLESALAPEIVVDLKGQAVKAADFDNPYFQRDRAKYEPTPKPIETVAQNELFDQPEQGRVANPYEAAIGEWRVDENGMPIRADLSMEAANLENPLQRNLWGDELDPRVDPIGQSADLFDSQRQFQEQPVQGGVPLTQAMDSMPPDAMRAAVDETGMGRELPASPELEAAKMAGEGMRVPQSQRGAIDFGDPAKKDKINEILGTKQFATIPVPSEIIDRSLASGKDGSGSINFSAGGSLEAAKRASPLIHEGSRVVQGFKNRAENRVRETVIPVEKQLRSLSKTEVEDLASVFKAEMFADAKFTMQELADKGMSEKQLIAYQKTRDMFDAALKEQNRVRELQGRKPISAKEAYLSSRWQGDFRRAILNREGKLVWYLAADNKLALDRQEKALIKEFPDQYGSSVDSVVRSSRKGVEANDVYSTVLDVLGRDDPAVAKIAAWMEAQTVMDTRKALGQEKHFEPKSNIRGFVGDRPGANPTKEAFAMFQQQINYAKNAHNWTAMQEAGLNLKEVFANPDLAAQQPKNMAYLKEYFADQLGFNENQVIKAFEDQVRKYGVSPNQIGRVGTNIKALWVQQKLAVNAGFVASNVIQAGNILPHLTDLQVKYGGNPVSALANGMTFGPAMAIAHIAGKDKSFIKTLSNIPGYSPFIAKAMKYAEDNSIVSRTLADESPIEASFGPMNAAKRVGNATINWPESILRATTYMTYVEQLRSSGKFKGNDLELFRLAEERTNISMGDYRAGEKAPIFNKLGQLGDSLNVLTTFPMNYYNQWSWALREAGRKNPAPALTMLGVQGYMAGLMGVPGFAEADKVIEYMKELLSQYDPLAWKKIKDFNLKQIALDNGGEAVLYGGLSTQTGVGMTSRAAAPVPSEMVQTPAAPFIDLGKQAGSVASAIGSVDDSQKWAQAAYNVAPSGVQGALETSLLKDFTSVQRGDKRVYGKPTDMASRTGMYARTPEEEFLRSIGLRSQKEVVTRDRTYAAQKQAAVGADVMRELPNKIYNQLRNNNQEKVKDYITLYVELSGKPFTSQQLETQLLQEFTTADEKLALRKNSPVEQSLAVKRLRDTLQQMGYK